MRPSCRPLFQGRIMAAARKRARLPANAPGARARLRKPLNNRVISHPFIGRSNNMLKKRAVLQGAALFHSRSGNYFSCVGKSGSLVIHKEKILMRTARLFSLLICAAPSALFAQRSEEHTSELQSLMRISYAVFCLKKQKQQNLLIHTT